MNIEALMLLTGSVLASVPLTFNLYPETAIPIPTLPLELIVKSPVLEVPPKARPLLL